MALRYHIRRKVNIACAHALTSLPDGHKCKRLHGHNYSIEVELSSRTIDQHGMVVDFGVIKDYVEQFDHINLNDAFACTSAENLCRMLWDSIERDVLQKINQGASPEDSVRIDEVRVTETEHPAWLRREGI